MINLIVNGNSYSYPQPGDKANTGWGSQGTNWASAVTAALTALGLGGTLTPTPNAVVDISSTTKGILVPRLTTTQRNAITSPATSLLIFNTTLGVFQYYTGSAWITVGAKIPDNVQFDGTLLVNGNINTNGGVTAVGAISGASLNSTGNALIGNGLVSAPAYSFTNDSNSGLYRISEDKIGFAANGVRQGEFGIGYGGFTGNIIQVVNSENDYSHNILTTANWNSDLLSGVGTSWEISITPKYSNSKIILNALINGYVSNPSGSAYFGISIWRKIGAGAYSQIYIPMTDYISSYEIGAGAASATSIYNNFSKLYVDSPNTTSQINYKFSIRVYTGSTFYHSALPPSGTKSKSFCVLQEVQQ